MKKFFTYSFVLLIGFIGLVGFVNAQTPTIYASLSSGNYNDMATWETFTNSGNNTPGAQGTGTAAASTPSGTHFVYIRAGHTISMNGGGRACHGMFIEQTGKIWAGEATARRLQIVSGGTGFTYPQTDVITNNGTMGGVGDGLFFEPGTNCQNATITGSGSTIVQRLRVPGGIASSSGGVVNITIDKDIEFTQATNYAVSLIYNPQTSDNYTLTLNTGKTIKISNAAGYFNNNSLNSGAGFGNYTYNINGTLDLTSSTQTTNQLTAFSPTGGIMNLNIGGLIKTGMAFNSSPVAPALANLTIADGVVVDATLATVMNFNENSFTMATGTSGLKRTVPADGTKIRFPIGTAYGSNTHVSISNATGASDAVTASIKNTFSHPAPANTLSREWNLLETTAGDNSDTLRFEWTMADETGGFSGTNAVFLFRWDGAMWVPTPTSVSGAGTVADPYVAKGSTAFSQLGLFILSNSNTTPVSLVNVKAYQKQNGIQVEFANATEQNVLNYVVEKSVNGRFITIETLLPKTNNGLLNNYISFDANPIKGINVYRIKATERNGSTKYSSTLNVNLSATSGVSVYPNPIKGNNVSIQLSNIDKANYTVVIYNEIGQKVYTNNIIHNGGSATIPFVLPSTLKGGVYSIQVISNSQKFINKIVIE